MSKTIAINIETCADMEQLESMPDPDVKMGNITDPAKKAAKIEAAKKKQVGKMALDPSFGQVLCVSFAFEKNGKLEAVTRFASDSEEGLLISWIWKQLDFASRYITFNGAQFDFPFLLRRSLFFKIPAPKINLNRYGVANCNAQEGHIDTMQILHQTECGMPGSPPVSIPRTLGFYARRILDVEFPYDQLDQGKLGELCEDEAGKALVANLCAWNTRTTYELWQRLCVVYA